MSDSDIVWLADHLLLVVSPISFQAAPALERISVKLSPAPLPRDRSQQCM